MLEDRIRDGLTYQTGLRAPSAGEGLSSGGRARLHSASSLRSCHSTQRSTLPEPLHSMMMSRERGGFPGQG